LRRLITDLGGLTQLQAATHLGVRMPTLKARVQRSRRRLLEEFEACCELIRDGRGNVVDARPHGCGCDGITADSVPTT
jgi:predicted DNA-binding protein (UPF0251 family)